MNGYFNYKDELYHHGILGQKWGVKNGPPYPLTGGTYSESEKKEIYKKRLGKTYNKKHFDQTLKADKTTLSTLSYDQNRTKDTDMFFATHKYLDKKQYGALFNAKSPQDGTFKFKIENSLRGDIKVASEDSGANVFKKLYKQNRDFSNFVNERMETYFDDSRYRFKGYRESKKVLDKMKKPDFTPSEKDIQTLYRMFNYVIPYDGKGEDLRGAKDVKNQRDKFFAELKKEGYGAVLDTNDALYGAYHANSPIIVFDMDQVIPKKVKQTTVNDKMLDTLAFSIGKALLQ